MTQGDNQHISGGFYRDYLRSVLTRYRHFLFAFAVIIVGLAGRAAIDKMLALAGGAEQVALWAQLQSVVDMVVGVVSIGLGQGVTVLVAQQATAVSQRMVLRSALSIALVLALTVGITLFVVLASGVARSWWPQGASWAALAVLAGAFGVAASVLNAYWLGRQQQHRVLWLSTVILLPPLVTVSFGQAIGIVLKSQLWAGVAVTMLTAVWLIRQRDAEGPKWRWRPFFASWQRFRLRLAPGNPLWRYVPVGLSIGLASPLAQILVRGEVSTAMTWHDAGVMQAIWRSSEWVTASMAGVMSLVLLPRLSYAESLPDRETFVRQLLAAGRVVAAVTVVLLLIVWVNQQTVLRLLYESRVSASDTVVGLFYLGDTLRVVSWVILFGLLALRATWWVTLGEFLSLPMFALLVVIFSSGMSLERAAGLYLLTYAIYLAFNLFGISTVLSRRRAS